MHFLMKLLYFICEYRLPSFVYVTVGVLFVYKSTWRETNCVPPGCETLKLMKVKTKTWI